MSTESNSKIGSNQCLRASIFILVLTSSSLLCVEGKSFEVSGPDQSQKVVVDHSKTVDVEFDPSLESEMNSDYASFKEFSLTIGDCNLDIGVYKGLEYNEGVFLNVNDSNVKTYLPLKNPNGFKVSSSGIKFDKFAQSFCSDDVNFKEHPDDKSKYLLEIKIGEDAPESFGLRSDSDLYEPSSGSIEVCGMSIPNWVLYVSIAVLILLLIVLVTSSAFYIVIRNKNRKKNLDIKAKTFKTTISSESKSKNTTSKEDSKHDKPKQAKKKKAISKEEASYTKSQPTF